MSVVGIDGDGAPVENVVEDLPIRVRATAIHPIAARDAFRRLHEILRFEVPLRRRARLRQIERVENVWKRRDDIHRVVDDERRRFFAAIAGHRERPRHSEVRGIGSVDLIESGEACRRVVLRRHDPLTVLGLKLREIRLKGGGGMEFLEEGKGRLFLSFAAAGGGCKKEHQERLGSQVSAHRGSFSPRDPVHKADQIHPFVCVSRIVRMVIESRLFAR